MRILVVEDDADVGRQLVDTLQDADHQVTLHTDGASGLTAALKGDFDVLVVDRMLPKMDGLSLLRELRERDVTTPALILSALGQVDDRVIGLRAGGDDYLPKPYAAAELLARLEVLGRRTVSRSADTMLQVGDLELDRISHGAKRNGQSIVLQPREYKLLEYLMSNEDRLVTRTMLLQHVWNLHFDPQTNVIDVHISRLRAKIDKGFDEPLLHTVRGKGYRLGKLAVEETA
ncbi:MAG: response regulator transcription factor [Ahrensia sp.]|nr:response regulator transcription factor [Ahrensia sp.]